MALYFNGTNFSVTEPGPTSEAAGGYFTDTINPENGMSSVPNAQWFNAYQGEVQSVIAASGLTPTFASNQMQTSIASQINVETLAREATPGTTAGSFFANTTGVWDEGDIGVAAPGQSSAYLFNNQIGWGLYSASGGMILEYTRSGNYVQVGGGLQTTITNLNSSTINATTLDCPTIYGTTISAPTINGTTISAPTFNGTTINATTFSSTTGILLETSSAVTVANDANNAYMPLLCAGGTGANDAVIAGQFPSSLTINGGPLTYGYKKYPDPGSPSGYYIEQWATTASYNFQPSGGSGQQNLAATFPIAFPFNVLFVGLASVYPSYLNVNVYASMGAVATTTGCHVAVNNLNTTAQTIYATVFAKGY